MYMFLSFNFCCATSAERQRYAKIRAQMKIKERIRRDLGGLTDTVVSGMVAGTGTSNGCLELVTGRHSNSNVLILVMGQQL